MIHLKNAIDLLNSPEPVDLVVVTAKGEIQKYNNCIGLKSDHYAGVRNIKLLNSGEIRKIRDCLIIGINGLEVFL